MYKKSSLGLNDKRETEEIETASISSVSHGAGCQDVGEEVKEGSTQDTIRNAGRADRENGIDLSTEKITYF